MKRKQKSICTCNFSDRYYTKDGSKCLKCGKFFPLEGVIKVRGFVINNPASA